MRKPIVLFVDDEPNILSGLKRYCRSQRELWDMVCVDSGELALEILANMKVDVVVSDMRMPGMSGADLLETISVRWPGIVRFILSGEAAPDQTLRTVGRSHRFLAKPCDPEILIGAVNGPLFKKGRLDAIGEVHSTSFWDRLVSDRQTVREILLLLESESARESEVANLVKQDPCLSARLLQLVNSAYFGRAIGTSSVSRAVGSLGLERFKQLLEAGRLGNALSTGSETRELKSERAVSVRLARKAAVYVSKIVDDPEITELAYSVGLFLQLGQNDNSSNGIASAAAAYSANLLGFPAPLENALTSLVDCPQNGRDENDRAQCISDAVLVACNQAA